MSANDDVQRSRTDASIREILAVFDKFAAHALNAYDPPDQPYLVERFMVDVVDFGWTGWTVAARRAMLVAFLENAPSGDLEVMLVSARALLVDYLPGFERMVERDALEDAALAEAELAAVN